MICNLANNMLYSGEMAASRFSSLVIMFLQRLLKPSIIRDIQLLSGAIMWVLYLCLARVGQCVAHGEMVKHGLRIAGEAMSHP